MAKIRFFGLLFSFFCLLAGNLTPVKADIGKGDFMVEPCNLPAPDSFRITQVGGDFIKLAWKSVFPGANHQLTIMESDGAGGYVTILVENNVPGDTYNADNLTPGTIYRFVLATKCPSGDPSEVKTIIDGITLIIDLMLNGRKPANPNQSGNCEFIPASYNWVGFNIYTYDSNIFMNNYFEVRRIENQTINGTSSARIQVLRCNLFGNIFATIEEGLWPDCDIKKYTINNGTRFKVIRLLPSGNIEVIGYVDVAFNNTPSSFKICPDYTDLNFPWKTNFIFEPLIAQKTSLPEYCEEDKPSNQRTQRDFNIKIENPFGSKLNISCSDETNEVKIKSFEIYSIMGELIFANRFDNGVVDYEFQTSEFKDGIYFIHVWTKYGLKIEKIVKITK